MPSIVTETLTPRERGTVKKNSQFRLDFSKGLIFYPMDFREDDLVVFYITCLPSKQKMLCIIYTMQSILKGQWVATLANRITG